MIDRTQDRIAAAGFVCAVLSIALGTSTMLFALSMFWMFGSSAVAFACGAAVRRLLDGPGMYPRSMKAIARAAEDQLRPRIVRRTAVALYLYMAGMLFFASALGTIVVVSFVNYRMEEYFK